MHSCPYCGNVLPTNAHFCGSCGRVITPNSESPTSFSGARNVDLLLNNEMATAISGSSFPAQGYNRPQQQAGQDLSLENTRPLPGKEQEEEDEEEEKRRL